MSKKKAIILTALITFAATAIVMLGGTYLYLSDLPALLGIPVKGSYSSAALQRAAKMIENTYYEDVDQETLYEGAIEGMVNALGDEYSWFVNEESYQQLLSNTEGEYDGIGVTVSIDPADQLITVIAPIEDSPAYKAGLKPGDKIIAVDGKSVGYDNYREAINMMRGAAEGSGSELRLTLKRANEGDPAELTLQREKIVMKTVKSRMLPNDVGYVRITSFDDKTAEQFEQHLKSLGESSLKGLVIDLRNNGGGTLSSTEKIADRLLPEGLITYFEYKDGSKREFKSGPEFLDIPLAVIINGASASASEVLSGALRDHQRATLVGEKSFGKGIVQTIYPFMTTQKGETAMYLTTARYFTPNGECIHGKGIQPDIQVSLPEELRGMNFDDMTLEQDVQLKTAWQEVLKKIS